MRQQTFHLDKDGKIGAELKFPVNVGGQPISLGFHRTGVTEKGKRKDAAGELHEVDTWAQGTFEVTERMLLKAKENALGVALTMAGVLAPIDKDKPIDKDNCESPKPGSQVTAWIKLDHIPIEGGVKTRLQR